MVSMFSANVSLADSISLKFHPTQTSLDSTGVDSVTLTGPNGQITYTAPFEKDDFNGSSVGYSFAYPLYATQLDEDVKIQFNKGDETVKIKGDNPADIYSGDDTFSYNVNTYCDKAIASTLHHKQKGAVRALKNLGIAADNYFEGASGEVAFVNSSEFGIIDTFAPSFSSDEAKLSLVLDSKLSTRLYIDGLTAGDKSDDGQYTAITGKDGKACFEISHINPAKLSTVYSITYKGKTYDFSAISYCSRAVRSTDPKTADLAKAAFEYYKYANIYTQKAKFVEVKAEYIDSSTGQVKNDQRVGSYMYTDEMTWAMLADYYDDLKIENGRVWLKFHDHAWDYIEGVSPDDHIQAGVTYWLENILD